MKSDFAGILPAVASPCDEKGVFLEDEFAELVKSLYREDIAGLYVCGGTGDGLCMPIADRKRAAEIAVKMSASSKGKVIVHVGAQNTRDSVELAVHAAEAGAAAVSSMPPAHCNHRQVLGFYADIAGESALPLLIYHIPALSARPATVEEILEMLEIDGVIGLKFTDWNLSFMQRLLHTRPEITIFSGMDELLCPALLYGACGGIGTWYNVFGRLFVEIYRAVQQNKIDRAMELQNLLNCFVEPGWKYGMKPYFEYVMRIKGLAPHCFRRPHVAMNAEIIKDIEPEVEAAIATIEQKIRTAEE